MARFSHLYIPPDTVGVIEQAYASLAADHWVPVPAAATGAPARQVRGGSAA